jgi:hypothetical protein
MLHGAGVRTVACVLVVLVACSKNYHVDIPAPPSSMTPAERAQAFQHYRQRGQGVDWVTSCNRRRCSQVPVDLLLLNNGAEIRYADELRPILSPTSVAGRAALDIVDARRRRARWKQIAWGGFLGGLAAAVAGAKLDSDPLIYGGLGVMIAVPFVGVGGMVVNAWQITSDTRTVFAHYDQGLAERFNVCVNGYAIVACELSTPGAAAPGASPPPAEPDPALRSLRQQ